MEIFILLLLTLVNGFFALSEISFVALRKTAIENMALKGNKRARLILKLQDNPEVFLSSVQVGITLISIISGAYGSIAFTDDMELLIGKIDFLYVYKHDLALVTVIGAITYFSILLGELIPKSIGLNHAESIALACVPVINYFTIATYPFVKFLSVSTAVILKLIGIKEKQEQSASEEELRLIIKSAGAQGVLLKEQSDVHQNLFYFSDQVARGLMSPRGKMEWIDVNASAEEVLKKIRTVGYSKFPVCDKAIDHLKGVVSIKDFLDKYQDDGFQLKSILKEPLFFTGNTPAFNILSTFKKHKQYIGFVLDEFGHVEGVLTLKDLMEAIVGDLPDLDEQEEPGIVLRDDGSWLVNGSTHIVNLNSFMNEKIIEDLPIAYTTLAGFFLHEFKRFPHTGDKLVHNGYMYEVIDIDENRIDKILVSSETQDSACI